MLGDGGSIENKIMTLVIPESFYALNGGGGVHVRSSNRNWLEYNHVNHTAEIREYNARI